MTYDPVNNPLMDYVRKYTTHATHKKKFIAGLPVDLKSRILSGELCVDQDDETGLCATYPSPVEEKR